MDGVALISLQLVATPQGPVADEPARPFERGPVTIGRSPGCEFVLPDRLRVVSREHARLGWQGQDAHLTCLSAGAPVRVNDEAVAQGGSTRLRDGDLIHVGGFDLRFARLMLPAVPLPPPPPPDGMQPPVVAVPPARRARMDQFFRLDTPAVQEVAASTRGPAPAPVPVPPVPAAMPAPPPEPVAAPTSTPSPDELVAAFLAGAGLSPRAGTSSPLPTPTPEWMHHLGALLRASVDGTLALLHSRSTVKREMRAEMTGVAQRENNPLKFAPDAASALMHLVGSGSKRSPAFLAPVAAVKDAHDDLLAHHLAVVAGMRAAMFELIERLGPEAVVETQGPPRGLAALWPALHEAALWRRHRQRHTDLIARLDDDFEAVFGREFTKAYEAQARALREGAANRAGPTEVG